MYTSESTRGLYFRPHRQLLSLRARVFFYVSSGDGDALTILIAAKASARAETNVYRQVLIASKQSTIPTTKCVTTSTTTKHSSFQPTGGSGGAAELLRTGGEDQDVQRTGIFVLFAIL